MSSSRFVPDGGRRALCLIAIAATTACGGSSNTAPSQNQLTSSTLTATINGASFTSTVTVGARIPVLPNLPNGTVGVTGQDKLSIPYTSLTFAVPGVIGTYPLASTNPVPQNAALMNVTSTTTGAQWTAGGAGGGSGSITLSTLTSTGASGTFSMTLVPLSGSGASGNKVITNGKFNVKF